VKDTIERFCTDLEHPNHDNTIAIIRALNRHKCWPAGIREFVERPGERSKKAHALLSFWFTYGLHSIPRSLKKDLYIFTDAFKSLFPPYLGGTLVLFRGELASRHRRGVYGISWTPNFEKAKNFADRRSLIEGAGIVVRVEATPAMIVTAVRDHSNHTLVLGEDEYLVDPRTLKGKVTAIVHQ